MHDLKKTCKFNDDKIIYFSSLIFNEIIFMLNVSHGLQFNKLLSLCSIIFLNNNDLNPYKFLNNYY